MLFLFILLILFLNFKYIYSLIFIEGKIKIPYKNYYIKRIKHHIYDSHIDDLKKVAINSVGCIPNNPIFQGRNLGNKIVLIIYDKKKPIGLHIMIEYDYNNHKNLHTGLVLIDKSYQGKNLQSFSKINFYLYIFENIFRNIYVSDIGNSASGLKVFNRSIKNSFPNLLFNNKIDINYIKHGLNLVKNLQSEILFSKKTILDTEKFILKNSRDTNDLEYLNNDKCKATRSSDPKYNEYIDKNLGEYDDYLCMGKINLFNILF